MKNLKKINTYSVVFLLVVFLSSCGASIAIVNNHNVNTTQVQLSGNNFKVIDQVSGSSEDSYVFAIGGKTKRQLYENAYAAMIKKANLLNGSKAITNILTEEHVSGFAPFYIQRTITVSAQVIEFTK